MAAVLALLLVSGVAWWNQRLNPARTISAPAATVATRAPVHPPAPTETSAPAAEPIVTIAPAPAAAPGLVAARRAVEPRRTTRVRQRPQPRLAAARPPATAAPVLADAALDAPAALSTTPATQATAPTSSAVTAAVATDTLPNGAAVAATNQQLAIEERTARRATLPPAPVVSPLPVGGYIVLREYLRREALFVPEPPARELSGSVRVRFTVMATGKLENFRIVRGMRQDYDSEAIRLLCEGLAWQPGAANGRRADQVVEVSVSF
ncbi:energy transducer TonB [Hymenobacter elongatus]|uniref:TonB C-terminal domain-containing protein n=1 Tax=Hymenobacter elongatus TaxID=877208 RepID=A0A4Z0PEI5_9BACT|nr:energy transducer TonB [Hymenobacter elongatus]TGE12607.1 hypothetical protein E5J99_20045 [Hymenobacter elongatus]